MIPKVIHYCWFGGNPLPTLAQRCIDSWKRYCPDYKIVCWSEANFDLDYNAYVREAYEAKKWAFITDVVRLYVLVSYGGIYMDTDVEIVKPLDDLLRYKAISGFESGHNIPTGLMACQKGFSLFQEFLQDYENMHYINADGSYDTTTNVTRITNICRKYGFVPNNRQQTIKGFTLFPSDYFCPKNFVSRTMVITDNTYAIHHFDGSWLTESQRYVVALKEKHRRIPRQIIAFIAALKYRGVKGAFREVFLWFKRKL